MKKNQDVGGEGETTIELLEEILNILPSLPGFSSPNHTVLIHGMGGQSRSFYRMLQKETYLQLLWTNHSINSWWAFLFRFIPGESGLIKVLNRELTNQLFLEIGAQSVAGLYFVPNNQVTRILNEIKQNRYQANIESLLSEEDSYFLLRANFDTEYEVNSDKHYRNLIYGNKLDAEIKNLLLRL